MCANVSGKSIIPIFRVENQPSNQPTCNKQMARQHFEMSVHIPTTRRYIPEGGTIHNYRYENLKSYIVDEVVSSLFHSYNVL
jgi:hypothetical protein